VTFGPVHGALAGSKHEGSLNQTGAASMLPVRKLGDRMSINEQDKQDHREMRDQVRASLWRLAGPWWMFLLTGIGWLIISMVVLRVTTAAAATIGVLAGLVLLGAMLNEFLIALVRLHWRWAHVLMGIVFLAGAIWAFVNPRGTFWALAAVIGLLLILQGALVLITSVESRVINGIWWLGLVTGILEIVLGFWASQQLIATRAALLIIWIGALALFRGISEIVLAFELKSAQHR
jgi:uncharacterized membrane protein HdeD (DUF308 family)